MPAYEPKVREHRRHYNFKADSDSTRAQHGLNSARFDNVIEFIVKEKRNFVEPIVEDDGKTSLLRSGAGFQV